MLIPCYQPLVCKPCGSQWRMRGQKLFQAHSWLPQAGHVHMCRSAWAPRVCPACSWTGGLHFLCSSLRNPSSSFSYAWTVICKTEPQIKISLCYKIINHGIKYIFQILNSCLGGYHNYYSDGGVMITIGTRYCPWQSCCANPRNRDISHDSTIQRKS